MEICCGLDEFTARLPWQGNPILILNPTSRLGTKYALNLFDDTYFGVRTPWMKTRRVSLVLECYTNDMSTQHNHTFWQIFCGENIKPAVQGGLVFLLEIPGTPGIPVLRNVFDPLGIQYPANSYERLQALLEMGHHGILFEGVSKAAVEAIMDWEPGLTTEDTSFAVYNRRLVWSSLNLLLCDPFDALEQIPEPVVRMLKLTSISVGN